MDLKKIKPSDNFQDRTNYTPRDHAINELFVKLNPVYAMRKYRDYLIESGEIDLPDRNKIAPPVDFKQMMMNGLLNQIMKERDLVDPNVILSGKYGDLIPTDERMRQFNNVIPKKKKK